MSDQDVASHTLELLKRISARLETIAFDIVDIKSRLTNLEEGQASLSVRVAAVEVTVAGFGKRMDRMEGRLERIERRLDLRDGAED